MEIPWQQLRRETLAALVEEFVTRQGAEHGHEEVPLERKVGQVTEALRTGKAAIMYDEEEESCTIVGVDRARRTGLNGGVGEGDSGV